MRQPTLVLIDIGDLQPSLLNCRLFVDTNDLTQLIACYEASLLDSTTVIPDPPILRPAATGYEIVAGERRVMAALMAGITHLWCRVEDLTDEEAYLFLLAHNEVVSMTTIELAFRCAEMVSLGYTFEQIETQVGGISWAARHVKVGQMVDRDWFTDDPKQCDPSITEWHEAACLGTRHFRRCFVNWVTGNWSAAVCSKKFRGRGSKMPKDNAERGFRVTRHGNRILVRGMLDLDNVELDVGRAMLIALQQALSAAESGMLEDGSFGSKLVELINPLTVAAFSEDAS